MQVQERIRKIADELFNGNISAFCRAIDVKQPTMNTILGERKSKPSYDVLLNIVNAKALNISAEWLLNGEGDMLTQKKKPQKQVVPTQQRRMAILLIYFQCQQWEVR